MVELGEDEIIYFDGLEYVVNIEKVVSEFINFLKEELKEVEFVYILDCLIIESLVKYLDVLLERIVKVLIYKDMGIDEIYMVLIRGDFEVNEVKLKNILNVVEVEMVIDEEIEKIGLKKGYIGLYKLFVKIKIVVDLFVLEVLNYIVGFY